MRTWILAVMIVVGCGSKKAPEEKKQESADKAKPATPAAKASKEDCTKMAQRQIELETDPQMKATLQSSQDMMIKTCSESMTAAQAQCAAAAADRNAFADCALK
jgi:hypothetical protein